MHAKPVMGYPSTTQAIVALRREGRTEKQIAGVLGIKPNTVTSLEARHRRRLRERRVCHLRTVCLPGETFVDLVEAADSRGLTANGLARELLKVIAADDLFVALLGEGGAER